MKRIKIKLLAMAILLELLITGIVGVTNITDIVVGYKAGLGAKLCTNGNLCHGL